MGRVEGERRGAGRDRGGHLKLAVAEDELWSRLQLPGGLERGPEFLPGEDVDLVAELGYVGVKEEKEGVLGCRLPSTRGWVGDEEACQPLTAAASRGEPRGSADMAWWWALPQLACRAAYRRG